MFVMHDSRPQLLTTLVSPSDIMAFAGGGPQRALCAVQRRPEDCLGDRAQGGRQSQPQARSERPHHNHTSARAQGLIASPHWCDPALELLMVAYAWACQSLRAVASPCCSFKLVVYRILVLCR